MPLTATTSEAGIDVRSRCGRFISVVTTAWNEEESLQRFYEEVRGALLSCNCAEFEILVVDNGSSDGTLSLLRSFHAADPRLVYLQLSRNFGHQGGLIAGMENCRGDVVITLDADLQHPPALIPELIALWEKGFDVVNTQKLPVDHIGRSRRLLNGFFYRALSTLCRMPLNERQSDFRLFDRVALVALISLPERAKFLRGLSHWIGFRQTSLPYRPAPRYSGRSKFSLTHLVMFAVSGVLSFTTMPLRAFTFLGMTVACLAMAYGAWAIAVYVSSPENIPPGWASLAVGICFLGGLQLLGIGVVGEYVGRVLSEVHGRPAYIVRERSLSQGSGR